MKKLIYDIKLESNQLSQKTEEELTFEIEGIKKRALNEQLDNLISKWFALTQEVSFRKIGLKHFDTQLLAGMLLHQGKVVEMKTGEGKTLVSTLPVALNALSKKGVHVVTVNDYLAERDQKWMGKVYNGLGLSVGLIKSTSSPQEKQRNYGSDITYVTNSEVVFDYLRDSSAFDLKEIVQRPFHFCLIDEIEKTEMFGRFKMMDDQTEEGMLPIIAFLVLAKAVNACRKTKPVLISSKNIIFQF